VWTEGCIVAMESQLPHLLIKQFETSTFSPGQSQVTTPPVPTRDRAGHSAFLKQQLAAAWAEAKQEQVVHHTGRNGVFVEIKGEPGYQLVTKSLENLVPRDIADRTRLLNVRCEPVGPSSGEDGQKVTYATIFIPHSKKDAFFNKIEQYATEENSRSDNPKHAVLLESISGIRKALEIESFWQDEKALIPAASPEWCEVWLSSDSDDIIQRFETLLTSQQINCKPGCIKFPDRAVKLVHVNRDQLASISRLSDDVAEYRRAKETAAFWLDLDNKDQAEWVESVLERINVVPNSDTSICILDTGVNRGHPLLAPVLSADDCASFDAAWGTHDHDKHGTLMAGLAAYNDLQELMLGKGSVNLAHCLESVKILPPTGGNAPHLWGHITAESIYKAEIQAPERRRIGCMAVTTTDNRDQGRPSSWSGALDQLCSGAEDDHRRLLIVSAGNSQEHGRGTYPDAQETDSVHDPAQSWNALTIGAFTQLDEIREPSMSGYAPIAPSGGLSPFSTTSTVWNDSWPIKPELVLEGGNLAREQTSNFISQCADLSLLSTFFDPQKAHFYPFCMTSAATAQAAWMAAQISVRYPDFWPETVRGLMIHSADWTDTLKQQFCADESKTAYKRLLRSCGYGVPSLEKALHSASNRLTLIAQEAIQPFDKRESGGYRTRDMHLYELPWPKEALQQMAPDATVRMRVTLSYFIEPSPGEVGWKDRYRYASHGLRFDLNSPTEDRGQFERRINDAARDEENGHPGTNSPSSHWLLGQARNKGSIHSDIWSGTAAELAESNLIVITPLIGWWRVRPQKGKWDRTTRYALIVSIETPETKVDLYTPVRIQLQVPVSIGIST